MARPAASSAWTSTACPRRASSTTPPLSFTAAATPRIGKSNEPRRRNFQYVLVVWMANTRRFAKGIDPEAPLLSALSQPSRAPLYFACCLLLSTVLYLSLDRLNVLVLGGGFAVTTGLYMGINFHHYIVDALIWRRRRLPGSTAAA